MSNHLRPARYVRAQIPGDLHEELRHLGIHLRRSIADMLPEAVLLLLRHHRGEGAPAPTTPKGEVA